MDAANMRRKMLKPLSRNYHHESPYQTTNTQNFSIGNTFSVMLNNNYDSKQSGDRGKAKTQNSVLEVYDIHTPRQEYQGREFLVSGGAEYGGYVWIVDQF